MTTATTLSLPPRGQLNRAHKVMSADEIDAFLTTSFCGRTATIGADGYPYVVPQSLCLARFDGVSAYGAASRTLRRECQELGPCQLRNR